MENGSGALAKLKASGSVVDSFTYSLDDGHGGKSTPVTVKVTVTEAGGNGEDTVFGGDGADPLYGENGKDFLNGGAGIDHLTGGNGSDVFVMSVDSGRDTITDFRPVIDRIVAGYAGSGSEADLSAWLNASHAGSDFAFADIDRDGNGQADAVAITGSLGANSVVLGDWTVAALVGQGYLSADLHVKGGWLV